MRRTEKSATSRSQIDRIILESEICHLSCCLDNQPYLIPIAFGYDGNAVYIHTAPAGRKISIFEENSRVCLSFVSRLELKTDPSQACRWSFDFSSVIAEGTISEITASAEKVYAINQIMSHYSGRTWDITEQALSGTRLWKIQPDTLTGKISPSPQ